MKKMVKKFSSNALAFVCDQYLILYFIIAIGIKLALFNANILHMTWPENQYYCGVLFGFLSLIILFAPIFFASKRKNLYAIILASFLCILMIVDKVYYSYFQALPTVGILSNAGEATDVGPAIMELIGPDLLWYIFDIILILIFYKKINNYIQKNIKKFHFPRTNWKISAIFIGFIFIYTGILLAGMGENSIENKINRSYDPTSCSQFYGLFGAHSIDIARYVIQETTHLSDSEVLKIKTWIDENKPSNSSLMSAKMMTAEAYSENTQTAETTSLSGIANGKNIIMIQVESLGGFAINQVVDGQEITPNLNKLTSNTYYYPNLISTIAGGHTSDADFVSNTSYFPFDDAAVFVRFGQDDFTSLPKNLIANGYSAYAYHGFNRNFWNRNVTYSSLGYQKFYASDNYSKAQKINMGLNDGTFLSETANYIAKQPKPSFSYVITLTSHTPFNIPDDLKGLKFTGNYTDKVKNYLLAINYTDRMLGKFFEQLKSKNLYDDSLIVVYGDHDPVMDSFTAGNVTYDAKSSQSKEVPLFIKTPNSTASKTIANTGTQLDIMPTILDLAGVSTNDLMFGRSLTSDETSKFTICQNQIAIFGFAADCNTNLTTEKQQSAQIIRYNLFDKISN